MSYPDERCAGPEWPTVAVDDLAEKVAMGPFGSSIKVSTFVPKGVPIISGQHLHGIRVDDSPGFNFITQEHARRLRNANARRGDVVLTHRGTIGQVSYIPEDSEFDRYVVSQSQFYIRCDEARAIPQYVALYLTSPEGQHQLLANTSQVGVPSIAQPVTYLRTLGIPLPPLPEQRAIARILGTLDDKIELNRRMDETLEAMARALFKSWFIDFDPVRAKMEGRDTGVPRDIADLFPDRLVDSEIGEIPERWEVFRLDQLAKHHTKSTSPARSPGIEYEHFSIPAYDAGRCPMVELGSGIKSNKTLVLKNAVLLSKLNPRIPRVWMPAEAKGRPQVCSTEFLVFTPQPPANRSLLFALFADESFRALLKSMVTGTSKSHQRVPPKALKTQEVLAGSPTVFRAFGEAVEGLLVNSLRNRSEVATLRALRDTLLPKLLSGEIRVAKVGRLAGTGA